ncbi:MAG: PilZ domain-containing protein [Phycisphaerales bacterium]|nr:PilZ domain-containing protein [Phycisphaerales bacterium]
MGEATRGSRGTKRRPRPARDETPETLPFERRNDSRVTFRGQGVATFVEPDGRLWLTRVTLLDRSESGLGIRVPVPVAAGSTFDIALDGGGLYSRGTVRHAVARGGTYRLGLQCARRRAA